jgi:hypothetical protein
VILAAVGVVAALALVAAFVYALADQGDDRVSARWIDQHLRDRRDDDG